VELFLTAYLDTDEVSLQLVCSQKGIKFSPKITVDENTTFDNEGYGISLPSNRNFTSGTVVSTILSAVVLGTKAITTFEACRACLSAYSSLVAPVSAPNRPMRVQPLYRVRKAVLEKLEEIAASGKKSIMFAENPGLIRLMHKELKKRGVETVPFHGGISIEKRVADKNERFRNGTASHLLATKATARAGYNEPQADFVIFYDQSWSWRVMDQAMRRPLRPERKAPLTVISFIIEGSLDSYQEQMVAFKRDTAAAGLDWATPELDDVEFLHMGTIMERFIMTLRASPERRRGNSEKSLKRHNKRGAFAHHPQT
jgi:hypothetical protein